MSWRKPDDLELAAECESQPELEIMRGLLAAAGIESMIMTSSGSSEFYQAKSLFTPDEHGRRPYKLLVRPEDAAEARELLAATPEAPAEEDD